ncbi:hypothetical protein [Vibrio parahaemolyticus]
MSASAGTKWTDEDRETISNMTSEQQSQIQAAIESFRAGANQTIDASNRLTADERNSEVGSYATGFTANFNETQGLMTSATQSQQEVDTLSRANSMEQRQMASLTEKLEIPFQEFVEARHSREDAKQILTGQHTEAHQDRANEWEAFKQTDVFKDFVLASVPTQEAHQSSFNGEPTLAEWQAMAAEQYKGKALGSTSEAIINQHEQRGGTEAYYNPETHTQIVDDTRDQFERTSAHVETPASLQESDKQSRT